MQPAQPPTSTPARGLNGRWLPIVLALVVPTTFVVGTFFVSAYRIDANADDIEENGRALSTLPTTFVPREEIALKLQILELQVEAVQTSVNVAAKDSTQRDAHIIELIKDMDRPPP